MIKLIKLFFLLKVRLKTYWHRFSFERITARIKKNNNFQFIYMSIMQSIDILMVGQSKSNHN